MNSYIQELAGRANFGTIEKNKVIYDSRLKSFAEIIIRECAHVASTMERDGKTQIGMAILNRFDMDE